MKTLPVLAPVMLASLALMGCGNTTLTQQKALTEKVTPVLAELRQRYQDAELAKLELFALGAGVNQPKPTAEEVQTMARVLCATPAQLPGDALDTLSSFQNQLAALSKAPEATFSGLLESIDASRSRLKELEAVGDFEARAKARHEARTKQEQEVVKRGLTCAQVVQENFGQDLSAPDFGTEVKALGSVAVIQALGKLILKVEEIADRELRAQALRKYVAVYKAEVAVALDDLDGSTSQIDSPNDPVLRPAKAPASARSAMARMLRVHLQYLGRKALHQYRDARDSKLPKSANLQAARAFGETAGAHTKVLAALVLTDKTLASLRTWYAAYIAAIEAGPNTPTALIDALFSATKDLAALDDLYGAFDKAKGN
jgi:hypothetical protein